MNFVNCVSKLACMSYKLTVSTLIDDDVKAPLPLGTFAIGTFAIGTFGGGGGGGGKWLL